MRIFALWCDSTPISKNRQAAIDLLRTVPGVPLELVTESNLSNYILPDHPLHEGYPYLTGIHRSDYLRWYLMHHYGGGYADIKNPTGSWVEAFKEMDDPEVWMNGYPIPVTSHIGCSESRVYGSKILGNGSLICRPGTPYTTEWGIELHKRMDALLPSLRTSRRSIVRDCLDYGGDYPVPWSHLLGSITHSIQPKYFDHFRYTVPPCSFSTDIYW